MLRFAGRMLAAVLMLVAGVAQAQTISLGGGTYSQDFNTLANTAGSTTNTALPTGWLLTETGGGTRDNEQYAVDTGSGNTGDTYSYGSSGSTERAFGGLRSGTLVPVIGACFTNATGNTLGSFDIAYTGEQWRLGTISRTDSLNFEYSLSATSLTTGTWTSVAALNFVTPTTATVGAKDGNAAANRTALSATISSLAIGNGATFCIRWTDTDAASSDDGLAIDDFSITVSGTPTPSLTINDVGINEGDAGTVLATFTASLSAPAGPGGVSFDIATANGTASAGSDYVAQALSGQTIPAGSSSYNFSVVVNGDTTAEANETFFVNISNVTGAIVGDAQGQGTIQNDDVTVVQIHDIQGNGLTSPLNGATVTTEGIVTAQKFNNGFFLQTADASVDADPNTSQGIFVFTSTAPPATAAVGNRIRVTGTVTEFTPSTNLNQLSITEIVSVTSIIVISSGNALPAPVALTSADFGAGAAPGTAEKYEGMRVSIASARVVAGADGNITESSATSSTTGVFHVILPDVARPFREAGIGVMDVFPIPGGKTPPRFDTNQERLMVRSRGQIGATAIAVDAEAQIANMTGVLDYFSGTWALLPDAGSGTATGGKTPTAVADPRPEDVTIAGANLLRFFDEVNDSNGAPTLTAAAVDKRLTKTALAICDYLKAPDILGVVEVENLRVLGLLADRINTTCAFGPDYVPYLVQGNDQGGINVGFLVKNRPVGAGVRVEVLEVTQFGKTTLFTNPDSSTSLLNDRPPLLLRAIVHAENGASWPVTVVVNHLRSLNGLDDTGPGSSGWPTEGDRVRNKRGQQAMFLANLVHARQQANPNENIVLLGDFNAFEFSDGYIDVMGIVRGNEAAEPNVVSYFDSPITAPLIDGSELILDPSEKYSYVFEGSAQTLDHVVINEPIVLGASDIRVDHARINADFGVHNYGVAGNAIRVSDHDPVRLAISLAGFRSADLAAVADIFPTTVRINQVATFDASITNNGPNDATSASIAFVFDALVSPTVNAPAGWTCAAPTQAGGQTTVTCTVPTLASGATANFTIDVPTDLSLANRTVTLNVAVASTVTDPANANNQASTAVLVEANADLGLQADVAAALIDANQLASFTVDVSNSGQDGADFASLALVFDALITPNVTAPAGWTCAAPVQDASTTTVTCTTPKFEFAANVRFTIGVLASGPQQADWTLRLAAAVTSQVPDALTDNNSAMVSVRVRVFADLDAILNNATPTIDPGDTASLTATLVNNGPANVASATATFGFDALVSPTIGAPAGWTCAAPTQTATDTSVVCTGSNFASGAQPNFAIGFVAAPALAGRNVTVSAEIVSGLSDPFPGNNRTTSVVVVRPYPNSDLSVLTTVAVGNWDPISIGSPVIFEIAVANDGPGTANEITLSLTIDALVTPALAVPTGWNCGTPTQDATSTSLQCIGPRFAPRANALISVEFPAVIALAGRLVNLTATVSSERVDTENGNNSSSAAVQIRAAADLRATATAAAASVPVGGTVAYTATISNLGPNAAAISNVSLSFDALVAPTVSGLPAGWTCAAMTQTASTTVTCSGGIGIGGSLPIGVSFVATPALVGRTVRLIASVDAPIFDPVSSNNLSSAQTQIVGSDLSVRMVGRSGRAGVFLVVARNAGPSAAQTPSLSIVGNMLPRNVSLIPATGWTCRPVTVATGFRYDCNASAAMPSGGEAAFGMALSGRGLQTVTVTATVASPTPDPNPDNNSASRTLAGAGLPEDCSHRYCRR